MQVVVDEDCIAGITLADLFFASEILSLSLFFFSLFFFVLFIFFQSLLFFINIEDN